MAAESISFGASAASLIATLLVTSTGGDLGNSYGRLADAEKVIDDARGRRRVKKSLIPPPFMRRGFRFPLSESLFGGNRRQPNTPPTSEPRPACDVRRTLTVAS